MRLIVYIIIIFLHLPLYGQEDEPKQDVDFSSLTLRPNSRDYAPAYKDNNHQRLAHRRAVAVSNQIRLEMRNNPDFLMRHQKMQQKSREVMRKHMQQRTRFRQKQMIRRQMIRQQQRQENRPGRR